MFNSKRRFVATLTVVLVIGFLSTSLVSYFVARNSVSKQVSETTLPLTSDNIYSEIQRDLLRPIFISSLMAQDTFVRDWSLSGEDNPEQIIRYLTSIQERYDTITAFFVSNSTFNYYHPDGIIKQVSPEDPLDSWYFRARDMAADYEINVDNDTADRTRLTIFINYRVKDFDGNFIGLTGVGLAMGAVKSLIETYQHRYQRQVLFTDRDGNVMLHGDTYDGPMNIREFPGIAPIADAVLASDGGSFTFEQDGNTVYLNSRLIPEFDWMLLVEQEESPALQQILQTLWLNLLICFAITVVVVFIAHLAISGYQRRLEELATTDTVTGAANRRVFNLLFEQTVSGANRRESPVSAMIGDIDHFKQVNDTYGHSAGDEVLRMLVETIRSNVRKSDVVCRWGGEEFMVLLPDCGLSQAVALAEKVRKAVEARAIPIDDGQEIGVTLSFGVAEHIPGEGQIALVERADRALYAAKANGRNRVETG